MQVGLVGLGRMGSGIRERLRRRGHDVVAYDSDPALTEVASLQRLVERLAPPRLVWVMLPAGEATESVVASLAALLAAGDLVIDGGNSHYRDSVRRASVLAEKGIRFLDVGTSGGVWGLEDGFCLMAGGEGSAFRRAEPVLADLAAAGGYAHLGPTGAGHYAKLVHNAIEYGLLQAYAEGFDLLRAAEYDFDLAAVASLWNRGSVVRSWLLELAERALTADPRLAGLRGSVQDSGEGRWAVAEAAERGVPLTAIAASLFARFDSRQEDPFAMRFVAALRREFGGHAVEEARGPP
jgi:6-phosphogluconate dehydrogenase